MAIMQKVLPCISLLLFVQGVKVKQSIILISVSHRSHIGMADSQSYSIGIGIGIKSESVIRTSLIIKIFHIVILIVVLHTYFPDSGVYWVCTATDLQ